MRVGEEEGGSAHCQQERGREERSHAAGAYQRFQEAHIKAHGQTRWNHTASRRNIVKRSSLPRQMPATGCATGCEGEGANVEHPALCSCRAACGRVGSMRAHLCLEAGPCGRCASRNYHVGAGRALPYTVASARLVRRVLDSRNYHLVRECSLKQLVSRRREETETASKQRRLRRSRHAPAAGTRLCTCEKHGCVHSTRTRTHMRMHCAHAESTPHSHS